jgi:hypothetical protein
MTIPEKIWIDYLNGKQKKTALNVFWKIWEASSKSSG